MPGRIADGVYVHVDGKVFGPGDEPGPEYARLIRNPACWADGQAPADADDDGGAETQPGPPRSGRGSGRDVWVAFAEDNGIATVGDDGEPLSRDELIEACERAGVIEPEEG